VVLAAAWKAAGWLCAGQGSIPSLSSNPKVRCQSGLMALPRKQMVGHAGTRVRISVSLPNRFAPVAQTDSEHLPTKQGVGGSSPSGCAMYGEMTEWLKVAGCNPVRNCTLVRLQLSPPPLHKTPSFCTMTQRAMTGSPRPSASNSCLQCQCRSALAQMKLRTCMCRPCSHNRYVAWGPENTSRTRFPGQDSREGSNGRNPSCS
jgi:hypothetical protein